MIKFDEEKFLSGMTKVLKMRSAIEKVVDERVDADAVRNVCWLGIGGTYASCLQAVCHMNGRSSRECFAENAAVYCVAGNRRIGKGTLVIISSVTGTTSEMVKAVEKVRSMGAFAIGFIDTPDTALASSVDALFTEKDHEQLKFFMVADRLLFREGVFEEYADFYAQMDTSLPQALASVEYATDEFAEAYAKAHLHDALHYFVGAGDLYGAVYSYAMCYWEEMHWLRTKSIHSAEFFHGTLEIIDPETPVTLFVGEDAERPLGERVARFLEAVNTNHTVIDTRHFSLPGISDAYRSILSPYVMHAITNRIDAHLEALSGHAMDIRRYYRKVAY